MNENILLVDDEPDILSSHSELLIEEGYKVTCAESGEEALEILKKDKFDLVITDLQMDKMDGIELLGKIKAFDPELPVIIFTGYGDLKSAIAAIRKGVDDYIQKPSNAKEILFRISKALEKRRLTAKIKAYENILPVCAVCKKVRDDSITEPGASKWLTLEDFVEKKSGIQVSHCYCDECAEKLLKTLEN